MTGKKNQHRARTAKPPAHTYGSPPHRTNTPTGSEPGATDRTARSLTFPLPHSLSAPARARRLTRRLLDRWGLNGDYAARVEVVVSELVTNAVHHARPDVHITWRLLSRGSRPHVRVEVADGGPSSGASVRTDRPADERGRGMIVMRALASDHGTARRPEGGTLHWVEVATP